MQTARLADDSNAAALAALSADGPGRLASVAPTRPGMSPCPHCHEAFGSASLAIHIKRCRALLPDPEAEAAAAAVAAKAFKNLKKRQVPTLVDLCLRLITRNFQAVCMDKVMAAPEHEAFLIESLPTVLVHRIITNLVYENRKIAEKDDHHRIKLRKLEHELHEIKKEKAQLEVFRGQAAVYRGRLADQDVLVDTMRRELEATKNELASVRQQNAQLETRFTGMNMSQLRLDNRINNLIAENEKLKGEVRAVRKKEMEAFKLLASAAKSGKPIDQARAIALQASVPREPPTTRSNKRPAATEKRIVKPRPRTEGSKIPFPSHLPDSSRISPACIIEEVNLAPSGKMAAISLGLLPRTGSFMSEAIRREEEQLMENRFILSEVHQVLDEMVYDIETCEHQCEVARLKHELDVAKNTITEYQQRESVLIQERHQAFEYAATVEQEAKAVMQRVKEQLAVLVAELSKKYAIEQELALAREQLHLSAQLSKELASAQREIRELHRKNSIQKLLTTTGVTARASANGGVPRPVKIDRAMSSSAVSSSPRTVPRTPLVSNQLDAVDADAFARCSDKALMNVFAHLDANSVFVVSLTSRTLMTRVHTLFGMPPNSIMIKRAKSPDTHVRAPSPPAAPSALKQGVLKTRSQSSVAFTGDKGRSQLAKAEMIVKSLKKDEIKLFHDLSTRVRTLESHLSQVQAEKEDIAARLQSAESVRDFLMDKLKELEDRLSTMMETTAKRDEQNAMDREIIGFLDARIHEYELSVKRLTTEHDELTTELSRVRQDHASKLTIVQDMVGLLTDEKNDLDLQLKAQRKVLVREVKALRAQNQQLTHDKERYFTQLKQLRLALQHLDDLS